MDKYQEIKAALEDLSDEETGRQKAAYMRNKFKFYGIKTPLLRNACKELIKKEKKSGEIDWNFLDNCWNDEHREFQYIVSIYLSGMQNILRFEDIPRIERYIRSKQWWDTIDSLDIIVGNIGLRDSRVNDLMLEWSQDEDFWVRRVAIDHQLCRKQKTDTALLERIILNNLGSKEFFINKAIGWSLRDYSKTDPVWVKEFIGKNRDRMSSLSIREGSKYI